MQDIECRNIEFRNIEFHGVAELEPAVGSGWRMPRFPKTLRQSLSPLGRMMAQESAGCELRFVTESTHLRLAVSSLPSPLAPFETHNQDLFIFKGGFFHSYVRLEPGKINHVHVADIGATVKNAFLALKPKARDTDYFNHNVWRFLFGRYAAAFHELDTYGYPTRQPLPAEKPKRRMLCYGSSITNGSAPILYHLCYAQNAARLLQADLFNQGLSGSCHCEKEIADYLAAREDWDLITLELGVNLRGSTSPTDSQARCRYLLEQIITRHPEKPVFLITIFPNAQSPQNASAADDLQSSQEAFDRSIRKLATQLRHPNLHLIEGAEILTDYRGMTKDLIHPGDYGHIEMGQKLAEKIRGHLRPPL